MRSIRNSRYCGALCAFYNTHGQTLGVAWPTNGEAVIRSLAQSIGQRVQAVSLVGVKANCASSSVETGFTCICPANLRPSTLAYFE